MKHNTRIFKMDALINNTGYDPYNCSNKSYCPLGVDSYTANVMYRSEVEYLSVKMKAYVECTEGTFKNKELILNCRP